jgi:2-keto-4-pentenoate hydratase
LPLEVSLFTAEEPGTVREKSIRVVLCEIRRVRGYYIGVVKFRVTVFRVYYSKFKIKTFLNK